LHSDIPIRHNVTLRQSTGNYQALEELFDLIHLVNNKNTSVIRITTNNLAGGTEGKLKEIRFTKKGIQRPGRQHRRFDIFLNLRYL